MLEKWRLSVLFVLGEKAIASSFHVWNVKPRWESLPEALRDHYRQESARKQPTAEEFLQFEDWLSSGEISNYSGAPIREPEWVIIYQKSRANGVEYNTVAALMEQRAGEEIDQVLAEGSWNLPSDFGTPEIMWINGQYGLYGPTRPEGKHCLFHALVHPRTFKGYRPACVEIDQQFLHYFDAFEGVHEVGYDYMDSNGTIHKLARIREDGTGVVWEVRTKHLKHYLSARKSHLVRFHDHFRFHEENHSTLPRKVLRNEEAVFDLSFQAWHHDGYACNSRLLGKDILYAAPTPDLDHIGWAYDIPDPAPLPFKVKLADGSISMVQADKEKLSNYFVDRGAPHYLTPVCFDQAVLEKYYAAPDVYDVGPRGLSCLSLWSLRMDVNTADLVEVYLGDLGDLNIVDQEHWKQFNVDPEGKTSKERFSTDYEAQWVEDRRDPPSLIVDAIHRLNTACREAHGSPLFLDLRGDDRHLLKSLRVPLRNTAKALEEQILDLAKMTNDSLNLKLIKHLCGPQKDVEDATGKLWWLRRWIECSNAGSDDVDAVMRPLLNLQKFRSKGAAHRKSSEWDSVLATLGIANLPARPAFRALAQPVAESLEALEEMMFLGD